MEAGSTPQVLYCFIGSGKWQFFFLLVVPAIPDTGCTWTAVMDT